MTDRITATLDVIEAAKEWHKGVRYSPSCPCRVCKLHESLDALASATSPDLDAKIADVLPCNCVGCHDESNVWRHKPTCLANLRLDIRDLIVALLIEQNDFHNRVALPEAHATGFEQAREQAAMIAENCEDYGIAIAIRDMTPEAAR